MILSEWIMETGDSSLSTELGELGVDTDSRLYRKKELEAHNSFL